jgi:DNA adenine methylase
MNFLDRFSPAEAVELRAQPFLKWAGGKRWPFKNYRHLFPSRVERLVDPFIGGGSSFFCLQPKSAILSDLNADLIGLYSAVRDNPRSVAKHLIYYHHSHCEDFYYRTRSNKPVDGIKRAAWSLYLNRTCWNGLYRVNLRGDFNVPIGTKTKVFASLDEFEAASFLLKSAALIHSDFEVTIDEAKEGDVVFADPPYFEKNRNIRFLKYNANVFAWPDQLRLRNALVRAAGRGVTCFVTNANHHSLVRLYEDCGIIHYLSRQSVVSGSNSGRKKDKEILVEIS